LQGLFDPDDYPDLLVGLGEPDDAAVWKLDNERALVATTDFFTPVVDDPYDYGSIAAANALSDIYAMGAQPFLALNIAALPPNLPTEISAEILRGGAEKVREAGVVLAGGHTVQDQEPKFGLMVLGFVHPERILSKGGARPGDVLLLSKPLGFGVITTALKREQVDPAHLAEAVGWMKRLNKTAAGLANEFGLRGGTDVTGFSLLGHASEVANASAVRLRFYLDRLPFTSGALDYAQQWVFPGGAFDNRLYYGSQVHFAPRIDEASQLLLFDPQTSGGLLLCVPAGELEAFLQRARLADQPLWVVGEAAEGQGIEVVESRD
jgi:selenide,water dikinase